MDYIGKVSPILRELAFLRNFRKVQHDGEFEQPFIGYSQDYGIARIDESQEYEMEESDSGTIDAP